jgi:PhnB protein
MSNPIIGKRRQKEKRNMANKPHPIPANYRRVTPSLVVKRAEKALEFYTEVFGAIERMRFPGPGGSIAHAEIEIGDSVLIVEDESPERGTKAPGPEGVEGTPFSLFLYVENVDEVIEKAVKRGARLKRPPENQFYGDRDGYVIDPFGQGWTVASHIEDVSTEEMTRRMDEMLKQDEE